MSQIVFEAPGVDAPGYLRRQRDVLAWQARWNGQGTPSPGLIDDMLTILLPYVVEPVDREEAGEALLDATEQQINDLMDIVGGRTTRPTQ